MNLASLKTFFTRHQPAPAKKELSPTAAAWLRGDDLSTGPLLTNAYQQVVWVFRAINALAEQVANIPFLFSHGQRGRESLITSGPLVDFYDQPHKRLNKFQYWELRVIWLMLRGECFRVPIYGLAAPKPHGAGGSSSRSADCQSAVSQASSLHRSSSIQDPEYALPQLSAINDQRFSASTRSPHPRRILKSILFLDPAHMHHIIDDHELVGWRYTGTMNGPLESQVFLPHEVWHERLPNPFDNWRGMPPLYVAQLPAQTDFAAAAFMQGLMENNADLGVIVKTDQQLTDEQQEHVLSALRNRKRRAGMADKPLVLSSGADIIKPALSSADLQYLENRKFSRSEICAAFGVPEEIITSTDKAKYDVMTGARLNFIENRVAPLCARLEAEERVTVRALDPNAVGWFDLDSLPIMQDARRQRLQACKAGFEMGIPFNELNRVFDLGFQATTWGNDAYVPSNMTRVGTLKPSQQPT